MNNEPVAWLINGKLFEEYFRTSELEKIIPLYTHPAKPIDKPDECISGCPENQTCDYCAGIKTLTDEEINRLWAESHEDGIAIQQGFTTQQHYFAHLILRKAQEK